MVADVAHITGRTHLGVRSSSQTERWYENASKEDHSESFVKSISSDIHNVTPTTALVYQPNSMIVSFSPSLLTSDIRSIVACVQVIS